MVMIMIVVAMACIVVAVAFAPLTFRAPQKDINECSVEELEAKRANAERAFLTGKMSVGQMLVWPSYDRMLERMIFAKRIERIILEKRTGERA